MFRIVEQIRKRTRIRIPAMAVGCLALVFVSLPVSDAGAVSRSGSLRGPAQNTAGGPRVAPPASLKFYCGDRIVAPGDTMASVLAGCGEPAFREMREDVITEAYRADRTPVNFVTTEEWAYNFGPHQFLRFLRFQGDRLAVIETGGYGYDEQDFGRNCDDGRSISPGDRKLEVLAKCGEPAASADNSGRDAEGWAVSVRSDEWTYNFGPDRFLYIVRFRHGKVYDIRTGGYGY